MLLVPLGVLAGVLTTIAGLGGGLLLVLALSLAWGPAAALAATAPALLLGNAHRLWLYRRHVDRRVATIFAAGALPGSLAGGALAATLPGGVLHVIMAATAGLAVLRAAGAFTWRPPRAALLPGGLAVGALAATSGGAGLLASPLFLSLGLSGEAYVATGAAGALAMHVGRIAAYGATGLLDATTLTRASILAAGILAGNLVGDRLRRVIAPAATPWIEHGALVAAVTLALAGL